LSSYRDSKVIEYNVIMSVENKHSITTSKLIEQLQLPDMFSTVVNDIYLPLSKIIIDRSQKKLSPLLISINGAQGTGKSTMTRFLKNIIETELKCNVVELSLDDFYLTRKERKVLAEKIHPLLRTRGVPGTHDVSLLESVLDKLMSQQPVEIPKFNKAVDDRYEAGKCPVQEEPVDIILFEGWCNNSPTQTEQELKHAINELEEQEDAAGVWRSYVNEQLIDYQKRIFDQTDMCFMLKANDFDSVYQWRSLQEQKLMATSSVTGTRHIMNDAELRRFIQHFERISRHTLKHLPAVADVVLPVAADQSILGVQAKLSADNKRQ